MPLQEQHAVDFLIETLMRSTGNITLATLGPLTNLAVAIIKQPAICERLQEVVMMGGALTQGNITPSAEFNVYVDPHAAQVVVTTGIPLTIVSLDVTHQAIATPERLSTIRAIGSPISTATIGLLNHYGAYDMQRYGFPGPPLHDPCVIAYLLQPDLFTSRGAYVAIETTSELTMGRTVIDQWHVTNQPANATVIETVEAEGFYQLLTQAIAQFKEHRGS
jgi:purine nucleosidase